MIICQLRASHVTAEGFLDFMTSDCHQDLCLHAWAATMLRLPVICGTNMCKNFVSASPKHLLSVLCLLAFEIKYSDHMLDHFNHVHHK